MAHFPPVRPVMPGTAPDPVPGARRTWLALLLGAGAVALLAGLAWGIITAARAQPGDPSPAARATPAASPALPGQQARYEVTRVRVAARPRGVAGTIRALEHAQDFVTVTVGVVLIGLAAVLVVDGLASFFHTPYGRWG